jgi:hypothetical protein
VDSSGRVVPIIDVEGIVEAIKEGVGHARRARLRPRRLTDIRADCLAALDESRTYASSAENGGRNLSVEALGRWPQALGLTWEHFGREVNISCEGRKLRFGR